MSKICVIGAGTMGAGIAQAFAAKGFSVILRDIEQTFVDRGLAIIEKNISRLVSKEKISQEEVNKIMGNVQGTVDLSVVADSDLVVEAAVEDMSVKKSIFAELDKVCAAHTILATNTSSLSITEVAAATNRPDKVIGMHWGTVVLSLEPIMEPPVRFKENAEKYNFNKKDAMIFKIGQVSKLSEILK